MTTFQRSYTNVPFSVATYASPLLRLYMPAVTVRLPLWLSVFITDWLLSESMRWLCRESANSCPAVKDAMSVSFRSE